MPQLESNGIRVEYDTFGQGGDDPVLLIMGLGTQMIAWTPEFCGALAAQGHYVIRFDNRDVGLSSKFDGARAPSPLGYALNHFIRLPLRVPYSLGDMASDAAGVLDALGIDAAQVVGASMGGMIAQLMAVNHPHRVKSLTSIMSTSGARRLPRGRPEVLQQVFVNRPKSTDKDVLFEYLATSLRMISSPGYPRSDEALRQLITESMERSFYPQGFKRQLAAIVSDGSRVRRLGKIDQPTLVIHGSEDPLIPVEHGIDTARHVRGSKLEIIEGMGHDLPPQLIDRLTTLIAGHARSSSEPLTPRLGITRWSHSN